MKESIKPEEENLEKKLFWKYARRNLEEMRLLFRGGRLSRKEGDWNNVIDHCLVQGAEADALSSLLGLKEEEKLKFQKAAFVHDWKQRLERKPGDFTEEQRERVKELLKQVSPDSDILASTEPGFSRKIIDNEASFFTEINVLY